MGATAAAAFARLTERPVRTGSLDRDTSRSGTRTLRWVEAGEGTPLVLVSGAGEVNLTWATVFDALSERGRVIAYDRAGLGDSDPLDLVTGSAEVDDLTALLDLVGPAVLVGHSWGGLLAQLAAWARRGQPARRPMRRMGGSAACRGVLAGRSPGRPGDQALRLHRTVVAAAPRGQYVEVDSGHDIQREHPDAVVETVDHVLEA